MTNVTEDFLDTLFADAVSSERRIALFTVPEKRPRFFASATEAALAAGKLALTQDVYFGVGLVEGTPRGRGKRENIGGIGALWADIDFAGAAHPDKALPANDEDLQRLLRELPVQPSVIIDSGHGRHLYWLLHEPWLFEDPENRDRATALTHGWHGLVCAVANRLGWSLENLGDLTRTLRLPDTVNRKNADEPITVRVLELEVSHLPRQFLLAA